MQQHFKAFRSLRAYNQIVSGFITSVNGHIIANKFVVLAKARYSHRMNDSLIPIWIVTGKEGTISSAHCSSCKAGQRNHAHILQSFTYKQGQIF